MKYQTIKAELKRRGASVKGFTRDFYAVYLAAVDQIRRNAENGIDDSYTTPDGIFTRRAWDSVRASSFYRDNGGAYCVFLEIAAE